MKNILVIGATGQIGSELTMLLRRTFPNGKVVAGYIKGCEPKGKLLSSGPSEEVDVCNAKQIADAVDKYDIDTIYNLAALLSATAERLPLKAWDIQMNGLINVLRWRERKSAQCSRRVPSVLSARPLRTRILLRTPSSVLRLCMESRRWLPSC